MIADLDRTLSAFLQQALPKDVSAEVGISFANPGDSFPSKGRALPLISLFLHGIGQREDLRDNPSNVQRQSDGTAVITRPPVFLSATYLVTIWTDTSADPEAVQEHGIISAVTASLLGAPVLPVECFVGQLAAFGAGTVTGKLTSGGPQTPMTVYQALGNRQKLSLSYEVTFPMPVFAPAQTPLVTGRTVRFRRITEQIPAPEASHA